MRKQDQQALHRCSLFQNIAPGRLQELLSLEDAELARAGKGEVIFTPTRFRRSLAVLLSGRATVCKREGERRILIGTLTPGGMFGMAAVFYEAESYPTEIQALSACRILFLSQEWLAAAFAAEPALTRNYIALLSERIHFLSRRLEAFAAGDCREKLLRCLSGFYQEGETSFLLPFSLTRLAEMLGSGRASLYRALSALEEEGVFSREGRCFTVLDPARLTGH